MGFFGLNFDPPNPAFRIEYCTKKNEGENYDLNKSGYAVYAYPLTKEGYEKIKYNLIKFKTDNKFRYSLLNIVSSAFLLSKNKIKKRLFKGREDTVIYKDDKIKDRKGLVCSSFIMYLLKECDYDMKNYLKTNHKLIQEYGPNELKNLPGIKFLFKGKWINYNKDLNDFLNKNKEYVRYTR